MCSTLASTCSPPRHRMKPACARVIAIRRPMVSATGRWLRAACSSRSVVERLRDRLQPLGQILRHAIRVKRSRDRVVLEQLFFADREQRTMQRGIDRQLVLGPLDRGQRGANRIDLLALVEGLAADQQVRNAARLERLDVLARDVLAEVQEAPEQQADVTGDDAPPCSAPLAPWHLGTLAPRRADRPGAVRRQQPADERPPPPAAATG